jgi:hypothetical protein
MNRKAFGYAEPILDYFATLVIFFIIAVFFFLFWLHSSNTKAYIIETTGITDGQIVLSGFLSGETKIGEEKLSVAELFNRMTIIELEQKKGEHYDKIISEASVFLTNYHHLTGCNRMIMFELAGQERQVVNLDLADKQECPSWLTSPTSQMLPRHDGRAIIVRVY